MVCGQLHAETEADGGLSPVTTSRLSTTNLPLSARTWSRETVLFMSAMGRLFEGTYDRDEAEPVIINAIEQPDTAVRPAFGPIASRTQPNS